MTHIKDPISSAVLSLHTRHTILNNLTFFSACSCTHGRPVESHIFLRGGKSNFFFQTILISLKVI